jgi:predicted DsbA family dithiol-disulfide isomerase
LGDEAFEKMHESLLTAYFTDNRDISNRNVLKTLWEEIKLPLDAFEAHEDEEILEAIVTEHNQAMQNGVSGVPAIMLEGVPGALVGAQEDAVYRKIIQSRLNPNVA